MAQKTSERRITDNLRQQLRLLEEAGVINYILDNVQPSFIVNDDLVDQVRVNSTEQTTTGATTLLTTPAAPAAVWLVGLQVDLTTDGTAGDGGSLNIEITPAGGTLMRIVQMEIAAPTVLGGVSPGSKTLSREFTRPIKLAPNTTVVLNTGMDGTGSTKATIETIQHDRGN